MGAHGRCRLPFSAFILLNGAELQLVGAGIAGQEESHALAAGINLMLWHDVTSGICQLQVQETLVHKHSV